VTISPEIVKKLIAAGLQNQHRLNKFLDVFPDYEITNDDLALRWIIIELFGFVYPNGHREQDSYCEKAVDEIWNLMESGSDFIILIYKFSKYQKMKTALKITTVISLLAITAIAQVKTGIEIAQEAEISDNGWISNSNILTMTLTNRKGQKTTRHMHGYFMEVEGDGDMSMTIFDTPADVKGTASMIYTHKIGDDDQWLYFPQLAGLKEYLPPTNQGPLWVANLPLKTSLHRNLRSTHISTFQKNQ